MAFRKRNVGLSRPDSTSQSSAALEPTLGLRPSPIDGRPTTSTGTPSLDGILAGHAGLALGSSLLLEESGTTDYAGMLLRLYAAEGVVQGHKVHVVGVGEHWGRELPGVVTGRESTDKGKRVGEDKMKIAWRYERLGEFGAGREGSRDRTPAASEAAANNQPSTEPPTFCHTFDLAKRLTLPVGSSMHFIPVPSTTSSPFVSILQSINDQLSSAPEATIHRFVVPSLLSPALYPQTASQPSHILQFLHGLRGLLRTYSTRLTAVLTLPLELYPRTSGLVRWMELLSDGVLELTPFPHLADTLSASGAATAQEERPQGMLKIHRLPVFHEKGGGGGGGGGLGDDLAFTASRRKFVIAKFSLPPVEGDQEGQSGALGAEGGKATKVDIEF
ncbi:PAXNEB family protein [Lophium mytilinum]|uniref:Elongator complex protein 4 n=1 Tax=Lophium mytilinum TaxID=390894 RepID=A0A6A6QNY0_9PEZI|nr:PAXNEB family protein [Lophium mytilinum]